MLDEIEKKINLIIFKNQSRSIQVTGQIHNMGHENEIIL
jgi:hypothetical protein